MIQNVGLLASFIKVSVIPGELDTASLTCLAVSIALPTPIVADPLPILDSIMDSFGVGGGAFAIGSSIPGSSGTAGRGVAACGPLAIARPFLRTSETLRPHPVPNVLHVRRLFRNRKR